MIVENSKKSIISDTIRSFLTPVLMSQVFIIPISFLGSEFATLLTADGPNPIHMSNINLILVFWITINTLIVPAAILIISLVVALVKKEKNILFTGVVVSIVMASLGYFLMSFLV